ncbi:MAG: hypothetical protein V7637_6454 [Mycobacteriales bacterium]
MGSAETPVAGARVVVTGAAGFIGSHLAEAVGARGATVLGVDRRDPSSDANAAANLRELLGSSGFTYLRADLRRAALEPFLEGADVIFHLAARASVRESWGDNFEEYATANLCATQRVMEAAVRLRVPRVVVASSSSVYGRTDGTPSRETGPVLPASPYAVTKLAAEQLALAHAMRAGSVTTVIALRYFSVFGPRQRADMFIHRVLRAALDGQPMRLFGDGSRRRDFTYVSDVVAATVAAGAAPPRSQVLNVGTGHRTALSEVLAVAADLTGAPVPVVVDRGSDGDVRDTLADLTAVRAALGWEPEVDLAAGMSQQIAQLRKEFVPGAA